MHWIPKLALAGYFYLFVEKMIRLVAEATVFGTGYRDLSVEAEIPIAFIALITALAIKGWCQNRWGTIGNLRGTRQANFVGMALIPMLLIFLWIAGLIVLVASPINLLLILLKSTGTIHAACSQSGVEQFGALPCTFNVKFFKLLVAGLILIIPWSTLLKKMTKEKAV
jgi:hypothetical protein